MSRNEDLTKVLTVGIGRSMIREKISKNRSNLGTPKIRKLNIEGQGRVLCGKGCCYAREDTPGAVLSIQHLRFLHVH